MSVLDVENGDQAMVNGIFESTIIPRVKLMYIRVDAEANKLIFDTLSNVGAPSKDIMEQIPKSYSALSAEEHDTLKVLAKLGEATGENIKLKKTIRKLEQQLDAANKRLYKLLLRQQ